MAVPLSDPATGLQYAVVSSGDTLYQEEFLSGPDGSRLYEQRRRIDVVIGSGRLARSYFTDDNGWLFQLPLTWYRERGWDFSPGYELNNARFDRLVPDGCLACHASFPTPLPFVEGKYATLEPGIGCERCHGPGALHIEERRAASPPDSTFDDSIVSPRHLSLERRLDVCEQCHVHTPVSVLREGETAFSYLPSRPLADHVAFFRAGGSIDVVSHADRLRQSACFRGSRSENAPLECATCHDPHGLPAESASSDQACRTCHEGSALFRRLERAPTAAAHRPQAGQCVGCHMPSVAERAVPHGRFTDHWIRVVDPAEPSAPPTTSSGPVEPYYERDRAGPEAELYQAMGQAVYGTLATDAAVLEQAARRLTEALAAPQLPQGPHDQARFLLGVSYEQLGRAEAAIDVLREVVGEPLATPARLRALAQAYVLGGRAADSTEVLFRRALELQPALAWIRAEYADFLVDQGRVQQAIEEYRRALDEQPSLAHAAFNLGLALTALGRFQESVPWLQRAVGLDPGLAEALAPLYEVRMLSDATVGVAALGNALPSLPVRRLAAGAPRVALSPAGTHLQVLNLPPGAHVQVMRPNGVRVRVDPSVEGGTWTWDLRSQTGEVVGGGLYRIELSETAVPGRAPRRLSLAVGLVRAPGARP